jgi:hypothetical protein
MSGNIALPFAYGDSIAELGGGDNPIKIQGVGMVNVDVRKAQGVDIVRNLEEDFSDLGKYDGVISVYLAEHISWRKIEVFFKSCFNILKEGKPAVFIVPDTEEQMKLALSKPFDLGTSQMIFGDQNYSDNNHKVAFSKPFITQLLTSAGFIDVEITKHPNEASRDIIVVAHRPVLARSNTDHSIVDGKPHYEEAYFTTEAYTYGGYRDFPVHDLTSRKVLERKPRSVVELGGAMGFICKRLRDAGVPATCIDVSKYCSDHRATTDFILMDLSKGIIPKVDKSVDLAFSIAFLEHIAPEDIDHVIRESMRVSTRGLHGITFTIEPNDIDLTHRCGSIHPREWWQEKFKSIDPNYPVEILDKEDLERETDDSPMQRYLRGELKEGSN